MRAFLTRKFIVALAVLSMLCVRLGAQTTITIGTGTSTTGVVPVYGYYVYSYSQILYTASEIQTAGWTSGSGTISKLRFYLNAAASTTEAAKANNWTVYLGNTSLTTLTAGAANYVAASAMTQVFSGTVTLTTAGWVEVSFTTPFSYTGGNLLVAVDENSSGYTSYSTTCAWRYTATTSTMTRYLYSDSYNPDPTALPGTYSGSSATTTYRPNIQLVIAASVSCSAATSLPTSGSVSTSANSFCASGSTILTFTPNTTTAATGITYKWQSTSDTVSGTWVDVDTTTTAIDTVTVSATSYFRCVLLCNSSSVIMTSYASPVITVTNPGTPVGVAGSRCGTGTVTLGASVSTGNTLAWYAASSGGSSLGTGTSFTTPTISATTTYYVGAESYTTGQQATSIGSGTSTTSTYGYPTAFGDYWYQTWQQMVYTAAELQAAGLVAGNITAITFKTASASSSSPTNYSLSIAPTTASTLSAFTTTGLTTVYSAATQANSAGLTTLTFTTPYTWDGTSNLILDIRQKENYGTANAATYYTTTTGNTVVYAYTSTNNTSFWTSNPTPTTSTSRLNAIFTGTTVCSGSRVAVTATVNTAPTFSITGNQTICNNEIKELTVTSTQSDYTSYTWAPTTALYTDAAATTAYTGGSAASVYVKSATAGSTVYSATAYNSTTACGGLATDTIVVLPASGTVSAASSTAFACQSGTTTLTLSPSFDAGTAQYQWQSSTDNSTFADISGATAISYSTSTVTATAYYRAVVKNSAGTSCFASTSDTLRIYQPTITDTVPASRCGPGTVTLGATASDGTAYWYAAATGGTSLGTGATYTTPSLTATTTYWVEPVSSSTISASVGSGTVTNTTYTYPTPFGNFWGSSHDQYLITASEMTALGFYAGNITGLSFSLASGYSSAALQNFKIAMANTTATALSTTFISSGFTTVVPAATYTPPSAAGLATFTFTTPFTWDGTSNIVVDVSFLNCTTCNGTSSCATSYTANGVVNQTSTSFVSAHSVYYDGNCTVNSYSPSGSYYSYTYSQRPNMVLLEAGCAGTRKSVTATINPLPTVTVSPTGPVSICEGDSATLTATGGGTYQWKNAAGSLTGQTNATFTTGTTGAYRVVVTTTATGCTDSSANVTVTVNTIPTVSLGNDTTVCSGNTFTLDAGNAGSTFLWDNSSTAQTRAVTTTGTYYVNVTTASSCSKSDTILVTVNPSPTVSLGNDTILCLGNTLVLDAQNSGLSILWSDASTGTTKSVTATGTWWAKVTNGYDCSQTDTINVTFLATPTVDLGADKDICIGTSTTLDAGNPGESFLWDNNDTTQTRTVSATGAYWVAVTNVANCTGTDTVQVTVRPLPVDVLGGDTTIKCKNGQITLDAGNAGYSYLWNTNDTTQTISISDSGQYEVVITSQYGCSITSTEYVTYMSSAYVEGFNFIPYFFEELGKVAFTPLNPTNTTYYLWDFGDGTATSSEMNPTHIFGSSGQFMVTLTVSNDCDSYSTSLPINIELTTGVASVGSTEGNINIYPNPARDAVTVSTANGLKLLNVSVYNVLGQRIMTDKAQADNLHTININGMASGTYTIRMETDKGTVSRKFEVLR
ncbi:MAG: T9SS type A sorting domain-containing protein [Edaphocola sp.]